MGYPFSAPNGDEETLNQQFAGYLYYSLQINPVLLNRIHHDHPLSFSDQAGLVAHQYSPLPQYTDNGTNRKIDWVVSDKDKLVGYESKYDARLSEDQLQGELEKLRVNANGRDIALIVVTMHTTPVPLLDRFVDEPVYWISWFTIFRRLNQTDETDVPPEQRPILWMLQDLFEAENMHPFTGFDHHDKLQYRYFIRDLQQELIGTELENPGKVNASTTKDPDPAVWQRLVPKRLDIPFVRKSRDEDWSRLTSYLTVIVDTESHDVHVGIVFNLRDVEAHQEYLADRLDDVIGCATEQDMELWASFNSLNQWKAGIAKTDNPAEMRTWLESGGENTVQVGETDYKKAIFVRECSSVSPAALVQEVKHELLKLYERFLVADDLYPQPTLGHSE
jgi:hypothetical protein